MVLPLTLLSWTGCVRELEVNGEEQGEGEGEGEGDTGELQNPDGDGCSVCEAPVEACIEGACVLDPTQDYATLTAGVSQMTHIEAVPSQLAVVGPRAHPLLVSSDGRVIVAFGRAGLGRYVVTGHESDFATQHGPEAGDIDRFVTNWIRFVGRGASPRIAVHSEAAGAIPNLQALGFEASVVEIGALERTLHDVFVALAFSTLSLEEQSAIDAFVRSGGGLLLGGTAWWWPEDIATTYPGNALVSRWGVVHGSNYALSNAHAVLPLEKTHLVHGVRALERIIMERTTPGSLGADAPWVTTTVFEAVAAVPITHPYVAPVRAAASMLDRAVSAAHPIITAQEPLRVFAVSVEAALSRQLPPSEVTASPSHAAFPGGVSDDAPREDVTVTIDARSVGTDLNFAFSGAGAPVWRSTGVYAAAGEVLTVSIPAVATGLGLRVQVGAHTDALYHLQTWERSPDVVISKPLVTTETQVASAYGGPVYVTVPAGADGGAVDITVQGGVRMGRFVLGQTTQAQWRDVERHRPTPWVELEGETFILTVPRSALLVALDDPGTLMATWDSVLHIDAQLAAIPRERPRKERFALDEQIAAGWMHSGYPIMGFLEAEASLLSLDVIRAGGSWGPLHELGHNHQWFPAVPDAFVEVTCNLYSVRASEDALALDRSEAWEGTALSPAQRASRVGSFKAAGRPWSMVRDDPALALDLFLQLEEAFGWSLYETVHREYMELPTQPVSDQEKIDTWVLQSSLAAGMDLSEFYAAWSLPFSTSVTAGLAALPDWTDHPMR